jgi:hypothetical protein
MTTGNLLRPDELLAQQSGNNRLRHHAATDKGQTRVAESISIFHKSKDSAPPTVKLIYRLMDIEEQVFHHRQAFAATFRTCERRLKLAAD